MNTESLIAKLEARKSKMQWADSQWNDALDAAIALVRQYAEQPDESMRREELFHDLRLYTTPAEQLDGPIQVIPTITAMQLIDKHGVPKHHAGWQNITTAPKSDGRVYGYGYKYGPYILGARHLVAFCGCDGGMEIRKAR